MSGTVTGYRVFRETEETPRYRNVDGSGAPALSATSSMIRALETLVEYPALDRVVIIEERDGVPDWSRPMSIEAEAVFTPEMLAWREELVAGEIELAEISSDGGPVGVQHYAGGVDSIDRPGDDRRRGARYFEIDISGILGRSNEGEDRALDEYPSTR